MCSQKFGKLDCSYRMDFEACMERANYLIQEAEHKIPNTSDIKRLPQFQKNLQNCFANALKNSTSKKLHATSGLLKEIFDKDVARSKLILSLLPPDDGYCINLIDKDENCLQAIELSYQDQDLLHYIDNEILPPALSHLLDDMCSDIFIAGCVPVEVRDYRISISPVFYKSIYILLKPGPLNMLEDVNKIANITSDVYKWTHDDKLSLESNLTLATSEPLCLDPSPSVMIIKNKLQNRNMFQTPAFKRRMRSCSGLALKRRKVLSTRKQPRELHLHDFLKKRKGKEKKQTEMRLKKDIVDIWRKDDLLLQPPKENIGVQKLAKPIKWPENLSDKDILEVQTIHLESEGPNRDVYSRITIGQRPGDMKFFGTLHSNKYFKQNPEDSKALVPQCVFLLGSEHRANLYILQYQELFTEDGRRPAKVSVVKSGQNEDKTFFIPNQQQPWELIQDKSMYSVGSVVDIPVTLWNNLKMKRSHNKLELNSTLHHRPPTTNSAQPNVTTVNISNVPTQHFVLSNGQGIRQKLVRKKSSGNIDRNDVVIVNSQPVRLTTVNQQRIHETKTENTDDNNSIQTQQQPTFKKITQQNLSQILQSSTNPPTAVLRMPVQPRTNTNQITAINLVTTSTGQSLIGPNGQVLCNIPLTAGPGGSLTIPASQLSAAGITMQLNTGNKNQGLLTDN